MPVKFELYQYQLAALLSVVGPIVEKKNINPILKNVKIIVTDEGYLHIEATNGSINVKTAKVRLDDKSQQGVICVDNEILSKVVGSIKSDARITCLEIENHIRFSSGKISMSLTKFGASDYPELPIVDVGKLNPYPVEVFQKVLSPVRFCVSNDEAKIHLNAVFLEFGRDSTISVATDGHRMAYAEVDADNSLFVEEKAKEEYLIPKGLVNYVDKVLSKVKAGADFHFGVVEPKKNKLHIVFSGEFGMIYGVLTDSKFVPYSQVIPEDDETKTIVIDKEQLSNAVNRASILDGTESSIVITLSSTTVSFKNADTARGNIHESIPCEYGGGDLEVAVNGKFLLQWVTTLEAACKNVCLTFVGPKSPILCFPKESSNGFFCKYILMPIKLN